MKFLTDLKVKIKNLLPKKEDKKPSAQDLMFKKLQEALDKLNTAPDFPRPNSNTKTLADVGYPQYTYGSNRGVSYKPVTDPIMPDEGTIQLQGSSLLRNAPKIGSHRGAFGMTFKNKPFDAHVVLISKYNNLKEIGEAIDYLEAQLKRYSGEKIDVESTVDQKE